MSDTPGYVPPPPPPPFPPPPLPPSFGGAGRTGPPWEQAGQNVQSFIDTLRGAVTDPRAFFATMRREGGLGAPLVYAIVGVVIGSLAQSVYSSFMGGFGVLGMRHTGFASTLLILPVMLVVCLFIGAGLFHLILSLLGAAKYPFEATFRVVAYAAGSVGPFSIVPICGGIIGAVYGIVLYIIGLASVQETDTGKAAIAVLTPVVLCCGAILVFWGVVMALIFGAAAAGSVFGR